MIYACFMSTFEGFIRKPRCITFRILGTLTPCLFEIWTLRKTFKSHLTKQLYKDISH